MPDDFLRRYTARQIAEIMAYYRVKHWDREREEQEREMNEMRNRHKR